MSGGICLLVSGLQKQKIHASGLLQKQKIPTSGLQQEHKSTPDQVAAEEDIIPETGWAWMILIGCFMYRILSVGVIASFGVLIVALEEDLPNRSAESLSWIGSLFTGLFYIIGKYQCFLFVLRAAFKAILRDVMGEEKFYFSLFFIVMTLVVTAL